MPTYQWSEADKAQLAKENISLAKAEEQLDFFIRGVPYTKLDRPAKIGDGLKQFSQEELESFITLFEIHRLEGRVLKFVPASGAATRMFKTLLHFFNSYQEISLRELAKSNENPKELKELATTLENLSDFAFYDDLREIMQKDGLDPDRLIKEDNCRPILLYLLTDKGLNYANKPKALLKFHRYDKGSRTALEEQLVEGIEYARSGEGCIRLHFTVSPEHLQDTRRVVKEFAKKYHYEFDVEFSEQKSSTNTLAVTPDNQPFRNRQKKIVTRPAGHGALIENLDDLEADIIFIKNIDNVVPDRLKAETYRYKKALGGYLISLQQQIFTYLTCLHNGEISKIPQIAEFMTTQLCVQQPQDFLGWDDNKKIEYIFEKLSRPIRVCGMVKNSGEPGGGPFWVNNGNDISLQIVESSQVNLHDPDQKSILHSASHFNPVDLVCGVLDFEGDQYNLHHFVDPDTAFISQKSQDGKELKALELPGLWNGAMADWLTIFVEVPLITFNPVKTINDLLRNEHQ